ncbi:MAG: hypothetical protein H7240_11630 [Glaciimonas sp.]|nr:hypothetical protein [Glaciimonas sp.]
MGVELSFYAMAVFVLRRRAVLFVLLFASILVRVYLFAIGIGSTDPWTYRFFPAELAFFLIGAVSHQLFLPLYLRLDATQLKKVSRIATFCFILFVISYFLIPVGGALKSPFLFVAFVTLLPLFFIYQRFNRFDRLVGELSYPIYVGHFLVIFLVEYFLIPFLNHSPAVISSFNVVFSVVFAIFLNRFIGMPVEIFRKQWRSVATNSHALSKIW